LPSTSVPSAILRLWQMSAYIDVQVTHDLLEYLALGDRTVIQGDHFGNALKREADLKRSPLPQIRADPRRRRRAPQSWSRTRRNIFLG
jgi:ABC-type nitrate/sulfonate/bicarbonate transport system ATPase subunit